MVLHLVIKWEAVDSSRDYHSETVPLIHVMGFLREASDSAAPDLLIKSGSDYKNKTGNQL